MKPWRAILQTILFRPGLYLANVSSVLLIFFGWLLPALLTREYFDLITGEAPAAFDFPTLMSFFVVAGLTRMIGYYGIYASNRPFMFSIATLLQKNMFRGILAQPGAAALKDSPGEAISRFRGDVDEVRSFPLGLNDLIGSVVASAAALVILLRINVAVTLVTFLPMVLVVVATHLAHERIRKYREASRKAAGDVTRFVAETFGAVQAAKVAGAEEHLVGHFRKLNDVRSETAVRDRLFNEILRSMFSNTVEIGRGTILIMTGGMIAMGTLSIGDFALFMYFLGFVTEMTMMIGHTYSHYKQVTVSVDRMTNVTRDGSTEELVKHSPIYLGGGAPAPSHVAKTPEDRLEELTASGLTYRHPGAENAIEDVSLRLPRGSFTIVTGRIGSGKTTLVRALLGLLRKDSGEIRWNGELVEDPATFFVPPRCAYTAQAPWLVSGTLRENLLMGLPDEEAGLNAAIYSAVMEDDLSEFENGLDTIIGPRGVKVSGGQAQRTAAARMFVRDSELLVFDDLSSALDVETERTLWQRLFTRLEATYLVISHRHSVLRRADHIIVMKDGRVEAEGKLDELLESCEEMQHLWEGDFGPGS